MDDKQFEQRLINLKESYDKMPSASGADSIMKKISETEGKSVKKKPFHLPYVASFVGVLLLAGILATQLVAQYTSGEKSNSPEEKQVSAAMIEEKSRELAEFYNTKLEELKMELEFDRVEEYKFVSEAKIMLQNFKDSSPQIYATEKNLDVRYEETKKFIERKLMTPGNEMSILIKNASESADVLTTDEEVISILEKQEELLPLFQEKWLVLYSRDQEQNPNQQVDQVDLLTKYIGYKEYQGTEINKFAEKLARNGYHVNGIGEMPEISINFSSKNNYDHYVGVDKIPGLSTAMQQYINIKASAPFITNGALVGTWDSLAEQLAQIEAFIQENPTFKRNDDLFRMYIEYFNDYMNNYLPNSPIFTEGGELKEEVKLSYERFIKSYQETESAAVIQSFYEMLEKNKFKKVNNPPEIPQLIEGGEVTEQEADVNRIEGESLELTGELLSIYKEYKQKQHDTMLRGLRPFDVMRLYMYASDNGDLETLYALHYKGEDSGLPPKDMYISERKNSKTNFLGLDENLLYVEEHQFVESTTVYMYLENKDVQHFILIKQNGVWKVAPVPMQ